MEQEYSAEEKQQMIEHYKKSQDRLYVQGKIIVFVIATLNVIGAIGSAFVDFNIISLIIQIALSISLFCGVSWVRYFFAVGACLSCFYTLYLLLVGIDFSTANSNSGKYLLIAYLIFMLIYSITSTIVLFKSKSVSEFLYAQKNE